MTTSPIDLMLTRILSGDLSDRAQGFLCVLPKGHKLSGRLDGHLCATYGTARHPDVRRLEPEGKGRFITVEAIRDAGGFLVAAPSGTQMKTLVVLEAERMNEAAANALLKPLEEPTRHTRIVLVTDQPGALLPTIRSRCITLAASYCDTDARAELASLRAAAEGRALPNEKVAALLDLADGDPSLALALEEQGLVSWIESLPKWLGTTDSPRQPRPLPKALGTKSGPDLLAAALGLQAFLTRAARGDQPDLPQGWTPERAQRACWELMGLMGDIHRAGLDAKTRLTVLMDVIAGTPVAP